MSKTWTINPVNQYDNISAVPDWLSDSMCRVATGGGLSKRRLYTDGQEVLYNVQRPQILNGIESLGERGDLLSRSIILELAPIAPEQRKTYRQFWTAFERVHSAIFGKLLDAVSMAIRNQDSVSLGANPSRLSDFCAWVRAACPALGWQPTQFEKAYLENRMVADWTALDASPLLKHLRSISQHRAYSGTASDLLEKLNSLSGPGELWSASWPKTPRGLVGQLARLAPSLRQAGIVIERNRRAGGNRDRLLTLRVFDPDEAQGMDPQASLPL